MNMEKRIITWESSPEYVYSRAFIFGNYGESFAHYCKLVAEAKKDFPDIKDEDIIVSKVHTSIDMKGYSLISFLLPANTKHPDYKDWDRFDFNY